MNKCNEFSPKYTKCNKYCITIPPPNITGDLHMGHAFQCTLMDILIRYYRMIDYSVLWKMGIDHAGIATQLLLEKKFPDKNISSLLKFSYKWKKRSFNRIKSQLSKLNCSLYFKTSRFTLDNHFSYAVKKAFIDLYNDNLIYKSKKLVNWDTKIRSAISDLEIIYSEEFSKLYYIKYKIFGENNYVVISTSRPETIFADVAVALNTSDNKVSSLKNKFLEIPIVGRLIPIIFDKSIDINFGSGCLKVTPAHDFFDFELSIRHNLPVINIFNENGTLNSNVPFDYVGMTVDDARNKVVKDLMGLGLICDVIDYKTKIPRADRSNSVVEPFLTDQWYVKTKPLIEPVLDFIVSGKIKIIPSRWKKNFLDWGNNIKDWCISRQIWWGHRLPVWYDLNSNIYVDYNEDVIRKKFFLSKELLLKQDNNVLDTWFSSALWPFASLGWPSKKKEYVNFYPTNTLVTGFDIIFFWVIRMLMFGIKFTGKIPFNEVYIHGLIRDNVGNKMSKTRGNVIDPIDIIDGISYKDLIDKRTKNLINIKHKETIILNTKKQFPSGIEAFGVDALRLTFASMATDNMFLNLDFKKLDKYKKFCTKILNASKFISSKSNLFGKSFYKNCLNNIWNIWIYSMWQKTKKNLHFCIKSRNFTKLISFIYNFFWINFCDWYIEAVKFIFKNLKHSVITFNLIYTIFSEILLAIYPIVPNLVTNISNNISIFKLSFNSNYPVCDYKMFNLKADVNIKILKDICLRIRHIKTFLKTSCNFIIFVNCINVVSIKFFEKVRAFICKMCNIDNIFISYSNDNVKGIKIFFSNFFLVIPLSQVESDIDFIHNKLNKMKLEKAILEEKLNNIEFLNNAKLDVIFEKRIKLHSISKDISTFEQFLF